MSEERPSASSKSRSVIIGSLLLAVAVTSIVVRREWLGHIKRIALQVPYSTSIGTYLSPEFRIDIAYPHQIDISFRDNRQDPATDCLIGVQASETCGDHVLLLQGKWRVYDSDGHVVAEGTFRTGGYRTATGVSRTVGSFSAEKGRNYRVEIENSTDATVLASMMPTLIVHPYHEFNTDWAATYFYVEPIAIFCGIVGIWLIVPSILAR